MKTRRLALFLALLTTMNILTGFELRKQEISAQPMCVQFTGSNSIGVIPGAISNAFKTGNSKELASYFNSNIELVVLDKKDVYSKNQAEIIIRNFFSKYRPQKFMILNQGGRENSKYAIGNLVTSSGVFRIYVLLKISDKTTYIHMLRIEEENN